MILELTAEEHERLHTVLDRYLADLRYEIANTDNSVFRAALREERATLEAIASRLAVPVAR
jgi:hypothetical protein